MPLPAQSPGVGGPRTQTTAAHRPQSHRVLSLPESFNQSPGGVRVEGADSTPCPAAGKTLVLLFLLLYCPRTRPGCSEDLREPGCQLARGCPVTWAVQPPTRPVISYVQVFSSDSLGSAHVKATAARQKLPAGEAGIPPGQRGWAERGRHLTRHRSCTPPEASAPGPGHLNPDTNSLRPRHTRPAR